MTLPTDYAGLTGWYDASQESYANNDPVDTWTDRSGNANHFTSSLTARPTFKTGLFPLGGSALDFDGSDDQLSAAGSVGTFISASAMTAFFVFIVDTISTNDTTTYYTNQAIFASSGGGIQIPYFRSAGPVVGAYNYDPAAPDAVEVAVTAAAAHVVMVRHEAGSLYISIDGGSESSVASGDSATSGDPRFGVNVVSTYFDGKLAELFFYNVALATGEIAALNTYLSTKWITAADTYTGFPRPQQAVYRM